MTAWNLGETLSLLSEEISMSLDRADLFEAGYRWAESTLRSAE